MVVWIYMDWQLKQWGSFCLIWKVGGIRLKELGFKEIYVLVIRKDQAEFQQTSRYNSLPSIVLE
jgi:hypothetical protein